MTATIAVASGKGGTGKTTVAVNLATALKRKNMAVRFVDCDVEEPNAHIYLNPQLGPSRDEHVPVPLIDTEACLGEECRKCVAACRFKALIYMADEVMVFPELCHGCGACSIVCPVDAVGDGARVMGTTSAGEANGIPFHQGLLRIGEAMGPPLIRAVINRDLLDREAHEAITFLDCPPGTSCPVVTSLGHADYAVLVAEPTPFGLHDLNLAVTLLKQMNVPFGVVINRDGMGDDRVAKAMKQQNVPILGTLPHSQEAATTCSKGDLLVDKVEGFDKLFDDLADTVLRAAGEEVPA